jgi:hypothetical protein
MREPQQLEECGAVELCDLAATKCTRLVSLDQTVFAAVQVRGDAHSDTNTLNFSGNSSASNTPGSPDERLQFDGD